MESQSIDPEIWLNWQRSQRPAQLVDVRSTTEFASLHIPSAINIPLEYLESRTADLDSQAQIVFVCQAGTRARMAQQRLEASSRSALVLEGGTDRWLRAGYPVICSTGARWSLERQVRFVAGLIVASGVLLGVVVSPFWLILPALVGCGLTFAGASGICAMGESLARLPWNRPTNKPGPGQLNMAVATVPAEPVRGQACSLKRTE